MENDFFNSIDQKLLSEQHSRYVCFALLSGIARLRSSLPRSARSDASRTIAVLLALLLMETERYTCAPRKGSIRRSAPHNPSCCGIGPRPVRRTIQISKFDHISELCFCFRAKGPDVVR